MNSILKYFFLDCIILWISFGANAQAGDKKDKSNSNYNSEEVVARIDSVMQLYVSKKEFEGVVLVAKEGKPVYRNAFGLANREWSIPNAITTKFRIGSITKPFTSVLVFQAIEKGLLRLDGKVTDYLPAYPKKAGAEISIGQLLSHTSGLIDFGEVKDLEWNNERLFHSQEMMLSHFKDRSLVFSPGTDFHYSNFGYYLLKVILENVSHESYDSLLKKNILIPSGMENTSTAENKTILEDRASGYYLKNSVYLNAPPFDQSVVRGFGDIISTAADLLAFDQALYTDKLLTKKSKVLMYTPSLPEKNNYAYGWYVKLPGKPGPNFVRHSGSINGFSTVLVRLIDDNWTIILLANRHGIQTIAISDAIKAVVSK